MTVCRNNEGKNQKRRIWIGVIVLFLLFAAALRQNPARHFYLLGAYVIGSILLVPITAMILVTFGPVMGSLYSIVGSLVGAAVTYAIGRFLGQDFVRKIAGTKWRRLEQKIRQTGIVAVTTLRLLPIAPFTVVNIISGAFKVPLRDYILGSLLGLLPGILITNLFAHQFTSAIRDPGIGAFLVLAALIIITIVGTVWLKRRFES
jgi:uncharacterized membrane protein YdjX (TVP38/TMEM64 family)